MNLIEAQIEICKKYNTKYVASPEYLKIGISANVKEGVLPINGLRIPLEGDTSGWYIWAGDYMSDDPDFFLPLHIKHLPNWSAIVIPYLGLPPGYRFLIAPDYEDVWEDISLLYHRNS